MGKLAIIFPGQGSQSVGMGKDLAEAFPEAERAFREADEALSFGISRLCFEGPEEELRLTVNTQPAVLAASVAAWRVLEARGVRPAYLAGHSLGEYTALVAAGSLSFPEALRLVRRRGLYMEEAVPAGRGGMAAVLGLDAKQVEEICGLATSRCGALVEPANYNCPGQVVISGEATALAEAAALLKEAGAKRVVPLAVSGPFHSALMQPAGLKLLRDLQEVEVAKAGVPVVANVSAVPVLEPKEIRIALGEQVMSPVRWEESVRWLSGQGVDAFLEVGPGKVLSGLVKKITPGAKLLQAEDRESLEIALASLREAG